MPYELKFSVLASEKLLKVPPFAVEQIMDGLNALAEDPIKHSRRVVSPPFAPFGYQCDIPCREEGVSKYHCVVFFVYSDCGTFLEIHRMIIQAVGQRPEPQSVREQRREEKR